MLNWHLKLADLTGYIGVMDKLLQSGWSCSFEKGKLAVLSNFG